MHGFIRWITHERCKFNHKLPGIERGLGINYQRTRSHAETSIEENHVLEGSGEDISVINMINEWRDAQTQSTIKINKKTITTNISQGGQNTTELSG